MWSLLFDLKPSVEGWNLKKKKGFDEEKTMTITGSVDGIEIREEKEPLNLIWYVEFGNDWKNKKNTKNQKKKNSIKKQTHTNENPIKRF